MKKYGILNSEIAKVLADMGHMDKIAIGDCGLPIDPVKKIDLSLKLGVPSFIDVLDEVLKDFGVEKYVIAKEIESENEKQYKAITKRFEHVCCEKISHEAFKEELKHCKAVIRTGENTPYSNIILQSKNIF